MWTDHVRQKSSLWKAKTLFWIFLSTSK